MSTATAPKADEFQRRSLAFKAEDQQLARKCRSRLEVNFGRTVSLSETMREALKALAEKLKVE